MVSAVATERRKPKKAKAYKKTLAQVEHALQQPGVIKVLGTKEVRRQQKVLDDTRRQLQGRPDQEHGGLRGGQTPSAPWFDARWYRGEEFPPGMDRTAMQPCKACGRTTPPQYITTSGHCVDCRYEAMPKGRINKLPGTCSKVNLAKMKASAKAGKTYGGGF